MASLLLKRLSKALGLTRFEPMADLKAIPTNPVPLVAGDVTRSIS
jgi:hypothetical protein